MASHRDLTFRDEARGALIAVAVGVAISTLAWGEDRRLGPILVNGSVIGFSIYAMVSLLARFLDNTVERLPSRLRPVAQSAIFIAGGLVGWTIGIRIVMAIYARPFTLDAAFSSQILPLLVISCAAVVTVGLVFRSFDVMHNRLKEQEWAQKELELARSIQVRLLPPPLVEGDGYAVAARNLPARLVAGDFYDVVKLDDGSIAVVVADVAGKGIGASLIMASVKAVVPFVAHRTAGEAMDMLNAKLVSELDKREFVALVFARYFPSGRVLHIANAGFPDPYLLRHGSAQPLVTTGARLPLGIRNEIQYETLTIGLEPADRVVFVSDGIPEAPIGSGDLLGYDGLADVIAATTGPSASAWLDAFLDRVRTRVGSSLEDDWTAVVLEAR